MMDATKSFIALEQKISRQRKKLQIVRRAMRTTYRPLEEERIVEPAIFLVPDEREAQNHMISLHIMVPSEACGLDNYTNGF